MLLNSTVIIEVEFHNPKSGDTVLLEAGALDGMSIYYVSSAGEVTFFTECDECIDYYNSQLHDCTDHCLSQPFGAFFVPVNKYEH